MIRRSFKVLLIEDDEDDYELVKDMLSESTSSRFDLDWVDTFEAGLSAVCRAEHDVVLLDYLVKGSTAKRCAIRLRIAFFLLPIEPGRSGYLDKDTSHDRKA